MLDFVGIEMLLRQHVQHHAGIDGAAACAHHQTVQRREAHGGIDTAAITQGAEAGAVAKMGGNDAPMRNAGSHLG